MCPPMLMDFRNDELVLRYSRPDRERIARPLQEPVQAGC